MDKRQLLIVGVAACLSTGVILGRALLDHTSAQGGPHIVQVDNAMTDILVTSTIANSDKPAALILDLSNSSISPQSRLELSVTPENVSPNEAYVVVVSPVGEPGKQLGSFAFFPPPQPGETRKFLVDVPDIAADKSARAKTKLSVELVPVDAKETLSNSSIKITGARVIGK